MRFEATVEENGCITIKDPQAAARLGLKPGEHAPVNLERLESEPSSVEADGTISSQVRDQLKRDGVEVVSESEREARREKIKALRGMLKRPGQKRLSLEDMDQAITDAMREKYGRP